MFSCPFNFTGKTGKCSMEFLNSEKLGFKSNHHLHQQLHFRKKEGEKGY